MTGETESRESKSSKRQATILTSDPSKIIPSS